jgi:signal peptidase I
MNLKWLFSSTVRQATAMRKHVQKILDHQRDILSPQAVQAVSESIAQTRAITRGGADKAAIVGQMASLEKVANDWLKPYPNAVWRENVEVLLVALTVAMGIRTFFLQPFKIPTGSMQPTLFGVTSVPDFSYVSTDQDTSHEEMMKVKIPTGLDRIREWFAGVSYVTVRAKVDGVLERVDPPAGLPIFKFWQTLQIGGKTHWILFPPDYGQPTLERRAGLSPGMAFKKGDEVVRLKVVAGDHLFVDRMSYNFVKPKRGEIIVFATKGIDRLTQDQFYIKRLVALGGEAVQIGDDRHLVIDGKRLDNTTPHFQNVYSFDPNVPPQQSRYSGHVNQKIGQQFSNADLAPHFADSSVVYTVRPDHYMVMGDNTMNSFDSRGWGDFPAGNVIGKSFFVYWPLTDRFGCGYSR